MLTIKWKDNEKTAKWAEKERLYHIAVSSYYYCLFQKIIVLSDRWGFTFDRTKKAGSHVQRYQHIQTKIKEKACTDKALKKLTHGLDVFFDLKDYRVNADYEYVLIDQNEYEDDFLRKYFAFSKVLDYVMEGETCCERDIE